MPPAEPMLFKSGEVTVSRYPGAPSVDESLKPLGVKARPSPVASIR
jgi:hypothetical protein